MNKADFEIGYKETLPTESDWSSIGEWRIFVSGYNSSERVGTVYSRIRARHKHWLVFPEYRYGDSELPTSGEVFKETHENEAEFIESYLRQVDGDLKMGPVCVDITGFMRPHLLYLLRAFRNRGIHSFDAIYSEPRMYRKQEDTSFTDGPVYTVRQVAGFEGHHNTDTRNDLLVIAAGYDHELIRHVAESKSGCRVVQIFGLPSLSAAMYQESVIRAARAADSISGRLVSNDQFFASANDPFVTASVLRDIKRKVESHGRISNLYLSPLATKPQALGFGLFYLSDVDGDAASIIFPYCSGYSRETSLGLSRAWKYTVELA